LESWKNSRAHCGVDCVPCAIKINMPLEQNKMEWLLAELAKTDSSHVVSAWPAGVLRHFCKGYSRRAFKRI